MAVLPETSVLPVNPSKTENLLTSALHILTIGVRVGEEQKAIGYVSKIDRKHSRNVTRLHQLEPFANGTFANSLQESKFGEEATLVYPTSEYFPGEAIEVVPGILNEETVSLTRYILYTSTLFEAFVRANSRKDVNDTSLRLVSLLEQVKPVELFEFWLSPINGNIIYGIHYIDCWFTEMGHTVEIGRESVVAEDGTLAVTKTRPFMG